MSEINWFKFENKDLDFPIYNKNPYVPKWGWIVLFISLIICYIFVGTESVIPAIVSMLIPLIPLLYFLKWDYHAIFQKPKAKDIALAIGLFIGYLIYAAVMAAILDQFGFSGVTTQDISSTAAIIPALFFSLMGEEFIKLIPFLFLLTVFFKYSDNRKLSVIASMLVVMIMFAALHAEDLRTLVFAIFVQGFGSIFEFIGYFKTKNVFISYLTHLMTDIFITLLHFI